ncbi:hypothetical protein M408DRAFT_326960 [Serendipita vermifera MAFF 305830]|uniref:Uncharacterized protein n=1 Tax=Serendipita vermifera MAFF 305830 TaxID=933852 RepID=A0A0C3BLL8_SERVB|nr:hypothetical protein M408DRAFT_326960 [Serendipita vermifera MAFF 305830]
MTGVRNLLLVLNEVPTPTLLTLLAAMPHLEKLEFKGHLSKEEGPTLIVPSLEELVVSNETILRYLQVPNALSIRISGAEIKGHSSISQLEAPSLRTLAINSSLASAVSADLSPHLTSLTWLDPAHGCAVAARSFDSLTRIFFDHISPRKECNDFCELILRYPASCRSLHTLEMRAYPEWDILLHMVQRRNLLPGLGVARLTTLKIPGYPAPLLLVPLTELLGGRSPQPMPPIGELCLGMVDAPYFDVNVPGCEDCIDSRMSCASRLDRHDKKKFDMLATEDGNSKVSERESPEQAKVTPLRGSDPPLPEELQTWFDGWSVRRTVWYAKWIDWNRHSGRKAACDRHDYRELVSITGDLLQGISFDSLVLYLLSREELY